MTTGEIYRTRLLAEQDRLYLEQVETRRQAHADAAHPNAQVRGGWMLAECRTNERNRSAD